MYNKRSTIQSFTQGTFGRAYSTEEIEVKALSFPSSGSKSWGRKKSSNVLHDKTETFVSSLTHIHRASATYESVHQFQGYCDKGHRSCPQAADPLEGETDT